MAQLKTINMPRQARKTSGTGIYHVMLRGINRQDIFEDDEDYMRFLQSLHQLVECYDERSYRPLIYPLIILLIFFSEQIKA